jgi:serine/threonine protein kinase
VSAAGSNCVPDELIFAFVHGDVSADVAHELEAHLNRCPDCRSVLAETARFTFQFEETDGEAGKAEALGNRLLEAGTEVSRYVIGGLIGVGAAGVVYGAQDPQLRRKIALKLMRPDHSHGPRVEAQKARLLREARAMARLSHPNVVTVFDVGTYEDQIFIVMELVEGETLDRWLVAEKRTWQHIVRTFTEAGRGLAAAHAVQIVHRDFKPSNVLVGSDGRVLVTDFGLAHPMDVGEADTPSTIASADASPASPVAHPNAPLASWTATEAGGMAGTPIFMAPEQFLRRRPAARTDQFSFCVALYMALYGHHPFAEDRPEDRTLAKLAQDVVRGRLHPPPAGADVPHYLFQALSSGLAVDPDRRFASMQELLAALADDHGPATTTPASKRRGAWIAAPVAAAVAVAIWAAARATKPAVVAGHPPEASSPIAADSVPATVGPAMKADLTDDSSSALDSESRVPAKRPPPARPAPRVDRKVRGTPPKATRTRYDDGLKDPF